MLYGDDQPRMSFPWVTLALILICVWLFIEQFASQLGPKAVIEGFGCTPAAVWGDMARDPSAYQIPPLLTLITSPFLHVSFSHLLGNMLFLWVFGSNMEDSFQWPFFLAFVFICAISANVAELIFDPTSTVPRIGASGLVSGVMGSYMVLFPRARLKFVVLLESPLARLISFQLPAWLYLGFWIAAQAWGLFHPENKDATSIAFISHVAGFSVGAALGWWLGHIGIAATNAEGAAQAE